SVIAATTARLLQVAGLDAFATDWFTRGLLTFTSGANAGRAFEVKRHAAGVGVVTIELWQEPVAVPQAGNGFAATAGCDKQLGTCAAKFANTVNFRGFPHMPGNDFVTAVAHAGRPPSPAGSAGT